MYNNDKHYKHYKCNQEIIKPTHTQTHKPYYNVYTVWEGLNTL